MMALKHQPLYRCHRLYSSRSRRRPNISTQPEGRDAIWRKWLI